MAAIEFKSVGDNAALGKFQPRQNLRPIGIKTPLRLGTRHDGVFSMHNIVADQLRDNLRNLLLTNHGERLGLYNFGANLQELSMEHGQETFDVEAIGRIRAAANLFMPYVELRTFESSVGRDESMHAHVVKIKVIYDVSKLGVSGDAIEVSIYTRG